ncbi:hypothetical protein HDU91_001866, partial [Kappamyces sp. JEL0680]
LQGLYLDLGHLLAARIAHLWIEHSELDEQALELLLGLVSKEPHALLDQTFVKTAVVLSSILAVEICLDQRVMEMLRWSVFSLHGLAPGDPFAGMALVGVLANLVMPASPSAVGRVAEIAVELMQLLESLSAAEDQETMPINAPSRFLNPTYAALQLYTRCWNRAEASAILNTIPTLKLLMMGFQLCFRDTDAGALAIDEFCASISAYRTKDLLKLLSLFLYRIKRGAFEHVLLTRAIPILASDGDAFVASACSKIALSLLQPERNVSPLELVGVEAITNLWKVQRRVWPQIKNYLGNWANRFKASQGAGAIKPQDVLEREVVWESQVTQVMLHFCQTDPLTCGKDLLPVIVSLLKLSDKRDFGSTRDLSPTGLGNLLAAFNACIEGDVTSPRT